DKVDSEIPSPVEGTIQKLLFSEGDVVAVGEVIAIIAISGGVDAEQETRPESTTKVEIRPQQENMVVVSSEPLSHKFNESQKVSRFYSPLVKNIAREENLTLIDLESIPGTGKDGRLTKDDLIGWLKQRDKKPLVGVLAENPDRPISSEKASTSSQSVQNVEIIEMDRMRRMIADHMVASVRTSPHVTSFIEVDVTNLVLWREKIKEEYLRREGEKITYMPAFIEAAAKALKEYANVNASVDGYNIIRRRHINVGIATALPNGNLIVPVIKDADQKNLAGLTKDLNRLANKARNNKLDPDDVQGGTFTITNLGTFGSLTGTPIINQPQVAILGIGVIKKKPVVIETPTGDVIAIRHMMILSLSYDHRAVDGALGGLFIKRIAELIENFDINRTV
ncbi:MAG TPA: dihydrolipoamide acetyltransferase family protein, partial [Bacteroidales bacterium]|nr:dihydrolipoamide acetyltransferase family protein [Bacteroidales bacterium]